MVPRGGRRDEHVASCNRGSATGSKFHKGCRTHVHFKKQSEALRKGRKAKNRAVRPETNRAVHCTHRIASERTRVPESLAKFWMGHAEVNQSEEYVKFF